VDAGRHDGAGGENERTVSQHLCNAYNKIGVNNRAEATRVAVEQGLT
jgi:DNA-binding NarL/FixJ family response regulator